MVDVINQGARQIYTGSVNDDTEILRAGTVQRQVAVYSYVFSSDSSTPSRVTLKFTKTVESVTTDSIIFDGYVSSTGPISHTFSFGDENYGEELYDLVVEVVSGGNVGYSISTRIIGVATPLGFIDNKG